MQKAVVTNEGSRQCVHLPDGFSMQGKEVYVKRVGQSVLLIPEDADGWDLLEASLERFTEDFMAERNQPLQQEREEL